jgi:hypothetical protein
MSRGHSSKLKSICAPQVTCFGCRCAEGGRQTICQFAISLHAAKRLHFRSHTGEPWTSLQHSSLWNLTISRDRRASANQEGRTSSSVRLTVLSVVDCQIMLSREPGRRPGEHQRRASVGVADPASGVSEAVQFCSEWLRNRCHPVAQFVFRWPVPSGAWPCLRAPAWRPDAPCFAQRR